MTSSIQPSPDAAAILRSVGWSADRQVDVDAWVAALRRDGNHVFALAEQILRSYGGIRLDHQGRGGPAHQDLEVDPTPWFDMRDHIELVEAALGEAVCPLGSTGGAAMLAVLEGGRVIAEMDGIAFLLGPDWSAALDHLVLGSGGALQLAEDYERIEP